MPPLDSDVRDAATGAFPGNHQTHQPASATEADCALCHVSSGFTSSHQDRRISISSNINSSPSTGKYFVTGNAVTFKNHTSVPVRGTCSNVNCHFETASPTWGAAPLSPGDPTDCATCHQMPPTSLSHTAHVTQYGGEDSCVQCHPDHKSEVNHFQHATSAGNRPIAVVGSGYAGSNGKYLPSQSGSRVTGSCSTASCHSNPYGSGSITSPVWGNNAGCAACHTGNPGIFQGNGAPGTGSHNAHMALNGAACGQCHDGAVSGADGGTFHTNGKIDVTNGYPQVNKHASGTYTGSCSTASCHSNPYGPGSVVTPVWGSPVGCTACHNGTGAFQANGAPATGSHNAHMALAGSNCGQCHEGAVKGTSGGLTHTNTTVEVSNDYTGSPVQKHTPGTYTGYCMNASCHASPYGPTAVDSPVWGSSTGCASCHNGTGAFSADGAPSTGSHAKHMALSGAACNQCHAGAVSGISGGASHANGAVDVTASYSASPVTKHPIGTYDGTCGNTSCHNNGNGVPTTTPKWGVAMPVNCTGCHGGAANVTPATVILNTGKHRAHMNNYSTLGRGNNLKCAECHALTVSLSSDAVVTGSNHLNSFKDYSGAMAGGSSRYATVTGVCSNVYCHSSGQSQPQFRNMTGSKAWRSTARLNCSGCHGNDQRGIWTSTFGAPNYPNKYDGTLATANSHQKHTVGSGATDSSSCEKCHNTTVDGSVPNKFRDYSSSHLNRARDVSFAIYGNYSSRTKSCTTYCHSNVQAPGGNGAATVYAKPAWGGSATTCASCHADMAALTETPENLTLGSHKRHAVDSGYSCSLCHEGYTPTSTDPILHANGRITVKFTGKGTNTTYSQPANNLPGDGYGTCSTSKCHGRATRNWGLNTTAPLCEKCHGSANTATASSEFKDTAGSPTSAYVGAHVSHLKGTHNLTAPIQCSECHVVPASVTSFGHMSSLPAKITWGTLATYTSVVRGGLGATMTPSYSGGTSRTCSNTYCHAGVQIKDPNTGIVTYQGAKPTPGWGESFGGTQCNMCHGYPPRGTHTTSTNCNACHSHVDQSNLAFVDKSKHLDRKVEVTVDDCLGCHSSVNVCSDTDPKCINRKLIGAHAGHTDAELFLAGKTLSKGDYIDNSWIYGIIYKKGFPQFGCGFCHPMDVALHKNGIIEVDMDPTHSLRGSVKTKNLAGGPWIISRTVGSSVVCNNVYCHSSGYVSPQTSQYQFQQTPDWYYADQHGGTSPWVAVDKCAQCHGNSPNTGGKEGSSAHGRHVVANHFKDVFDGYSSKLRYAGAPGTGAVHGDPGTATTFNCNICHFDTVRASFNDRGTVCTDCHKSGGTAPLKGTMNLYSSSTTHINGDVDVVFIEPFNVRSKAQLRDNLSAVQSVYTSWTRVNGYKTNNSYDLARHKPNYVGGTCSTTACHNDTQMEWRTKGPLACAACHTGLPQ